MKKRLSQRIRESMSLAVNKFPRVFVLTSIIALNILLFAAGGIIINALAPDSVQVRGFWPSVYYTISMILDAGNMAMVVEDIGAASVGIILVCLVIIFLGMLFFTGSVIGYITNYISDFIETAASGERNLTISDHTIIIGWNSRASEIINDMLYSDVAEKVVVLVSSGREQVQKEIRERLEDTLARHREANRAEARRRGYGPFRTERYLWHHRLRDRLITVVREGDPCSLQNLNGISIKEAKSVIILGSEETGVICRLAHKEMADLREQGNSVILKTLIQVAELTGAEDSKDRQRVIVEVDEPRTRELVERVIEHKQRDGKSNIVALPVDQALGQILSQFSIMPELNLVYDELFSNRDAAFYVENPAERFAEGSRRGSRDTENARTEVEGAHPLQADPIAAEEDFLSNFLANHRFAVPLARMDNGSGVRYFFMSNSQEEIHRENAVADPSFTVELTPNFWLEKRSIIVLGHNSKVRALMAGFESFRSEWNFPTEELIRENGSAEVLDICMIDTAENLEKANYYRDVPYVSRSVAAGVYDKEIITEAINEFVDQHDTDTSILVLSDDTDSLEDQDAAVMTYLIYLRDIVRAREMADPNYDPESIDIIYEILNPKNFDTIRSYSTQNVVISNRYISKMVAQISEKEEIYHFYRDILTYDSSDDLERRSDGTLQYVSKELYVKKASRFFKELPPECTAQDLIRAIYAASPEGDRQILLGTVSPGGRMQLYVGDQASIKVKLQPKDKLILFAGH